MAERVELADEGGRGEEDGFCTKAWYGVGVWIPDPDCDGKRKVASAYNLSINDKSSMVRLFSSFGIQTASDFG